VRKQLLKFKFFSDFILSDRMADKRVLIRGLLSSDDENAITFLFESSTFCPQGGDVDKVELRGDGVAIVTFEDASG